MQKARYIELCAQQADLPLFSQPFWWDAQCPAWDVHTFSLQGVVAWMPYSIEKKWATRFLRNPHLIPYVHVIFSEWVSTELETELLKGLLHSLPSNDVTDLDLSWRQSVPAPDADLSTHWKHTQVLLLSNEEALYAALKPSLKRQLKKADKNLHIVEKDDLELFLTMYHKTFQRQSQTAAIPDSAFRQAWKVCCENNCGKLLFIRDEQQQVHAALFLVVDADTAYYLAGGSDPSFSDSGAMSGLMWHAILQSLEDGKQYFDFEGSMLPGIDRFFRQFGPEEKKYLNLQKQKSLLHKLYKHLKK